MTFLKICQAVRAQAGISGEGPINVDNQLGIYADVVRWVEEAYAEIQSMYENWNFLHSNYEYELTAGWNTYDPSTAISDKGVKGIRTLTRDTFVVQPSTGGKKVRLVWVPWSVWQKSPEILADDKRGKPEVYTEDPGGVLHFYPYEDVQTIHDGTKDYNITFQAYSRPHIMQKNADVPIFNEQYHELIKLKALLRYAEFYNSMEIFQTATAAINEQMKAFKYSELPRDNLVTQRLVRFA